MTTFLRILKLLFINIQVPPIWEDLFLGIKKGCD